MTMIKEASDETEKSNDACQASDLETGGTVGKNNLMFSSFHND